MITVAGMVRNEIKIAQIEQKYQKKEARKKQEEMTPEMRQVQRYQEELKEMREDNQRFSLDAKLQSGESLTPEELEYLRRNEPDSYREYQEIRQEKAAYEKRLKSCQSKEEVEKLKLSKMGSFMAEAKSIDNNPNIPRGKKAGLMAKLLKKTMNVQKAHMEFILSPQYQSMPEEEEEEKSSAEGEKTASYEETKDVILGFLTESHPEGYGLESFDTTV